MFKKLFLVWVIALNLFSVIPAYAAGTPQQDPTQNSAALQSEFFMFDLRSITHEDVKEEKYIRQGINFVFNRAITIMAATIGTASVLMIMVGGFMILASGGREQWVTNGKSFIFKSLIGLVAALGAYIMVQTVQLLIKSIYG
ncbi:MAG: hypothetical protein V1908_03945 [Candidatus Peregrinibacteria bacterium]